MKIRENQHLKNRKDALATFEGENAMQENSAMYEKFPMPYIESPYSCSDGPAIVGELKSIWYNKNTALMNSVLEENGFINCYNGDIRSLGNGMYSGFIPAISFSYDHYKSYPLTSSPAFLVNTINNGMRFVGISDDGGALDYGPVTVPCITGNSQRPEGLYVPLTDMKAVFDAQVFLHNYTKNIQEKYPNADNCLKVSDTDEKTDNILDAMDYTNTPEHNDYAVNRSFIDAGKPVYLIKKDKHDSDKFNKACINNARNVINDIDFL